ncbi:MAG TPA: four helix bundle protein [Gemmataceae bacterium]|nr:four helix bundle protein [Gemmataceae bacterium]
MFQSFEDLEVWKRASNLAVKVYEALRECRDLSLRNQMQRAAMSIASNIAEGSERGRREFARFLAIARGSAAELRTQTYIAARIEMIDRSAMTFIVNETKELSKMLFALSKSIKAKLNTEN